METDLVEKISEYVPLFEHKILEQKYEKLLQEHESLKKTTELLKTTFGLTVELVNKQERESVSNEIIKEWENNIKEMQKRISRDEERVLKNNDSLPEDHMIGSKKKREKKREKKQEDSLCDEKMVDDAVKIPPQDPADVTCSQKEMRNRKKDRNKLKESNIADVTLEQEVSPDVNTKTQICKTKRRKKGKTKTMDVDKPLHVNDAENGEGEEETFVARVVVDLKSKEDKEELSENTDVKLIEDVVETQIPKSKRRKKKKTKAKEVCDPLRSLHVAESTKKEKEDPLESLQVVETAEKEKEYPLESVQLVESTEKEKEDPLVTVQVVETMEKEKEDKTGELVDGFEGEDVKTKECEMKEISLDHVGQGVSPAETGDLPKCPCQGGKKLIIFDLNGILGDVAQGYTGQFVPDSKVSHRSIFRRPFVADFLDFCFERFDIAIWSSRRIGLDHMVNVIMGNHARNLVLCFDQNKCTITDYKTLEKRDKPLFLKDLRRVWDSCEKCSICGNGKYNENNTLLIDDSPDKALSNPPHTAIFPYPYKYINTEDSALGPEGELKKYLERLADADNVKKFVAENPFGQPAITETHESWGFYSKVVEEYKC